MSPFGRIRDLAARALSAFLNLRLIWKLLLPYGVVVLVLGAAGTFVEARSAATQAQLNLDRELTRVSVAAGAHLHDRALFLSESAQVGANLEGIPEMVAANDAVSAGERIASLVASRQDLDLVVVADRTGAGLVEITRVAEGLEVGAGSPWAGRAFVAEVLQGLGVGEGERHIGFLSSPRGSFLAVAAPVEVDGVVGVVITGVRAEALASEISDRSRIKAALYDESGGLITAAGEAALAPPTGVEQAAVRRNEKRSGEGVGVLYAPLELQGNRLGTFAVRLPSDEFLGAVTGTRLRIVLLLAAAIAAVVGIGLLLSRALLRQLRPLMDTNRALGRGDLSARAEVLGSDELGELAAGINQMAEQLEANRIDLERRVAERTEELQHLYGELVELSEGRTEMFAGIVHELRGHLFAIGGYAELLADPKYRPPSRRWREEFGQAIIDQVVALSSRVNEILEVSKAEAGKIALDLTEVRVPEVVAELRATMSGLAMGGDLQLDIDLPNDLAPIRADRERLAQVVMNLVSNAVKYTPPGGGVRISATTTNGSVAVSVSDTGVGISESAGRRIFEPFYQVPGAKPHKGQFSSGLGLALVKRLVEAHGGTISFKSTVGSGTTFTFTLPMAGPTAKRSRQAAKTRV